MAIEMFVTGFIDNIVCVEPCENMAFVERKEDIRESTY